MLKTRVIPCLLLRNKGLVKTINFRKAKYIGDPINAVKIFNDKGVDELIFLDIDATKCHQKPDFALIANIAQECFMPFAYGGGISTCDDAKKLINLGCEKIIINTAAYEKPTLIEEMAKILGSQSVVVSIDVKKSVIGGYRCFTNGGTKKTKLDPCSLAKMAQNYGAGEIFLTSIEREGTWKGFDLSLIKMVADSISIPLIACGGAKTISDLGKSVLEGGASAVAAGSMFVYHGPHHAVLINFPTEKELQEVLPLSIIKK